jgi:hypothetical protein
LSSLILTHGMLPRMLEGYTADSRH